MTQPLLTYSQELFVIDPISPASQLPADDKAHEVHHHHHFPHLMKEEGEGHGHGHLEVSEPGEIEIVVEELPGAPPGTPDPEPILEVMEKNLSTDEKSDDANDAKKGKNDKWSWDAHGPHGFVAWIKSRLDDVPKHSGFDSAGLERAMAYMEKLDNEISKAMRLDLDSELDANKIEEVRSKLDDGLSRLQVRLDKVRKAKKSSRKKKADYEVDSDGFVKEAQKVMGVQGVYITVPLAISAIARICINGVVSGGHSLDYLYQNLTAKYKLTDREKSEVAWLLFDMGYAIKGDRGFYPDGEYDQTSSDNFDYSANFPS